MSTARIGAAAEEEHQLARLIAGLLDSNAADTPLAIAVGSEPTGVDIEMAEHVLDWLESRGWRHDQFSQDSERSTALVQWKGTDACIDLRCACGEASHFDGYFANAIMCVHCGTKFDVPNKIRLETHTSTHEPITTERLISEIACELGLTHGHEERK